MWDHSSWLTKWSATSSPSSSSSDEGMRDDEKVLQRQRLLQEVIASTECCADDALRQDSDGTRCMINVNVLALVQRAPLHSSAVTATVSDDTTTIKDEIRQAVVLQPAELPLTPSTSSAELLDAEEGGGSKRNLTVVLRDASRTGLESLMLTKEMDVFHTSARVILQTDLCARMKWSSMASSCVVDHHRGETSQLQRSQKAQLRETKSGLLEAYFVPRVRWLRHGVERGFEMFRRDGDDISVHNGDDGSDNEMDVLMLSVSSDAQAIHMNVSAQRFRDVFATALKLEVARIVGFRGQRRQHCIYEDTDVDKDTHARGAPAATVSLLAEVDAQWMKRELCQGVTRGMELLANQLNAEPQGYNGCEVVLHLSDVTIVAEWNRKNNKPAVVVAQGMLNTKSHGVVPSTTTTTSSIASSTKTSSTTKRVDKQDKLKHNTDTDEVAMARVEGKATKPGAVKADREITVKPTSSPRPQEEKQHRKHQNEASTVASNAPSIPLPPPLAALHHSVDEIDEDASLVQHYYNQAKTTATRTKPPAQPPKQSVPPPPPSGGSSGSSSRRLLAASSSSSSSTTTTHGGGGGGGGGTIMQPSPSGTRRLQPVNILFVDVPSATAAMQLSQSHALRQLISAWSSPSVTSAASAVAAQPQAFSLPRDFVTQLSIFLCADCVAFSTLMRTWCEFAFEENQTVPLLAMMCPAAPSSSFSDCTGDSQSSQPTIESKELIITSLLTQVSEMMAVSWGSSCALVGGGREDVELFKRGIRSVTKAGSGGKTECKIFSWSSAQEEVSDGRCETEENSAACVRVPTSIVTTATLRVNLECHRQWQSLKETQKDRLRRFIGQYVASSIVHDSAAMDLFSTIRRPEISVRSDSAVRIAWVRPPTTARMARLNGNSELSDAERVRLQSGMKEIVIEALKQIFREEFPEAVHALYHYRQLEAEDAARRRYLAGFVMKRMTLFRFQFHATVRVNFFCEVELNLENMDMSKTKLEALQRMVAFEKKPKSKSNTKPATEISPPQIQAAEEALCMSLIPRMRCDCRPRKGERPARQSPSGQVKYCRHALQLVVEFLERCCISSSEMQGQSPAVPSNTASSSSGSVPQKRLLLAAESKKRPRSPPNVLVPHEKELEGRHTTSTVVTTQMDQESSAPVDFAKLLMRSPCFV